MNRKKIILINGPTAVGKTKKAIEIALKNNCPIISADSRQVYRELSIGVARPSPEELALVKHYLIAHISIHDKYNAGIFAQDGRALINKLFHEFDVLVVCGGTGLYIKALLKGLDILPGKDELLRTKLQLEFSEKGIQALNYRLLKLDPVRYSMTDIQNPHRVMRAIEIASSPKSNESDIPAFEMDFDTEFIQVSLPREELYQRINQRVDDMIRMGLEKEVYELQSFKHLNALQTVGYKEWWPYFEGKTDLRLVIDKIKQHTRNYAKRQETWFKNQSLE